MILRSLLGGSLGFSKNPFTKSQKLMKLSIELNCRWEELSVIEKDHMVKLINHLASCPSEHNEALLINIEKQRQIATEAFQQALRAQHEDAWFNHEISDEQLKEHYEALNS